MHWSFFLHYLHFYDKIIKTLSIFGIAPPQATPQSTGVSCALSLSLSPADSVSSVGAQTAGAYITLRLFITTPPLRSAITLIRRLLFKKDFVELIVR